MVHTEIFDTQTHTEHGLSTEVVILARTGPADAKARLGISQPDLCFAAFEPADISGADIALPHPDNWGVGLASRNWATPKSLHGCLRCRGLGLRLVAHAGEEGPPATSGS